MYGSSAVHDEMFDPSINCLSKNLWTLKSSSCQTAEHIMPARPMNNLIQPKSNNAHGKFDKRKHT